MLDLTKIQWVAVTLFFAAGGWMTGCGGDEPSGSAEGLARDIVDATGMEPADPSQPCALLDDAFVDRHFGVAADAITRRPSKFSPHPLCTVSWRKANADEIEAASGEAMMEYMKKKAAGEDVEMPNFKTDNEVSLTINKTRYDDEEAAIAALEAAMRVLADGITSGSGDVEVTFQADAQPVDGIGHRAMWVPRMSQLSVAGDHHVFHVVVDLDGDPQNELEQAKKVAGELAARL